MRIENTLASLIFDAMSKMAKGKRPHGLSHSRWAD